jgi:hypothetical protein
MGYKKLFSREINLEPLGRGSDLLIPPKPHETVGLTDSSDLKPLGVRAGDLSNMKSGNLRTHQTIP